MKSKAAKPITLRFTKTRLLQKFDAIFIKKPVVFCIRTKILYYLFPGQSCAISLFTCLIDNVSDIKAIVEDNAEIIVVSSTKAREWFSRFPSWRRFVLKIMNECHTELIYALDRIAFKNIDQRLIEYLLIKSTVSQSNTIHMTHQAIANELSTSREAISRLLKTLEQQCKLKFFRNRIEIVALM